MTIRVHLSCASSSIPKYRRQHTVDSGYSVQEWNDLSREERWKILKEKAYSWLNEDVELCVSWSEGDHYAPTR